MYAQYSITIFIYIQTPGVLTLLKYPYPRDIAEPGEYDTIRVHAEWGDRPSSQHNDTVKVGSVSYWTFSIQYVMKSSHCHFGSVVWLYFTVDVSF